MTIIITHTPLRTYRYLYWSDWGQSPQIVRMSMDGSSRIVLHNTSLLWPNGLTLDPSNRTLYWADAGNLYDRIEASNTDGSNRRVVSTQSVQHPFGIDFFRGDIYRTDWQSKSVLHTPVAQPTTVGVVISNLIFDPMGIKVVSFERQAIGTQLNCLLKYTGTPLSQTPLGNEFLSFIERCP